MEPGIKFTVITKETYDDLRLLLDTLEGIPFDNTKSILYREAIRLLVETYEEETNKDLK